MCDLVELWTLSCRNLTNMFSNLAHEIHSLQGVYTEYERLNKLNLLPLQYRRVIYGSILF